MTTLLHQNMNSFTVGIEEVCDFPGSVLVSDVFKVKSSVGLYAYELHYKLDRAE